MSLEAEATGRATRPVNPLGRFFDLLSRAVATVERPFAYALVVGFVGLITANVCMRYLGNRPIMFAEELAAIMLVWVTLIAVSISIRDKTQVGIDLLVKLLPAEVEQIIGRVVNLLVAVILGVLLWSSVKWMLSPSVQFEQIITMGWAKWPFFLIMPIFSATSLIHILAHLFGASK